MSTSLEPHIYYDEEDFDIDEVEIWRSEADCLADNLDGFIGYLEQKYWVDGVPQFQTLVGFPLPLLKRYLMGMEYAVILSTLRVDDFLSDTGLSVPASEPMFIPLVSEAHLDEFARRCVKFGMLG